MMDSFLLVLKDGVLSFFLYAVIAVFAQNAIFTRALGVSRLIKLVDDPTMDTLIFSGLLAVIQVISCSLGYFINDFLSARIISLRFFVRPTILLLCTIVAFFVVYVGIMLYSKKFKSKTAHNILKVLPMATFNCCVLGTLLITVTQNYDLLETVSFAIGSSVGYFMAVLLVTEGQRTLKNRNIPQSFKGLPANLIYIGILALAIYGFTGNIPVF